MCVCVCVAVAVNVAVDVAVDVAVAVRVWLWLCVCVPAALSGCMRWLQVVAPHKMRPPPYVGLATDMFAQL